MKYAKALSIIKQFEGCKLTAYLDTGGVPTIGYGTTVYPEGTKVRIGDVISQEEADECLEHHLANMACEVEKLVKFPDLLSDNQMSAILSLVYNIGLKAFHDSDLLMKLNHYSPLLTDEDFGVNALSKIASEFLRWNHDNGKVVAGLTNRREKERELFLTT